MKFTSVNEAHVHWEYSWICVAIANWNSLKQTNIQPSDREISINSSFLEATE